MGGSSGKCLGCGTNMATFLHLPALCTRCAGLTSPIQKRELEVIVPLVLGPALSTNGLASPEALQRIAMPTAAVYEPYVPWVVSLRTAHDTYVSSKPNGDVIGCRPWALSWEKFTIQDLGGKKVVCIKNYAGRFLCCHEDGKVAFTAKIPSGWEGWQVITDLPHMRPGDIAFKSYHGKFLCAEPEGHVVANREVCNAWGTFSVTTPISFRTVDNKFLSSKSNGDVVGKYPRAQYWEKFTIKCLGEGKVAIANQVGRFLCCQKDGKVAFTAKIPQGWECWQVITDLPHMRDGDIAFKSYHGKFLCAEREGHVVANREVCKSRETFSVTSPVSFRTAHHTFLSSNQNGDVVGNCPQAEWLEQFTVQDLGDGKVAIKDYASRFLCCQRDGKVDCTSSIPQERESWQVITDLPHMRPGDIAFRSYHGKFLRAEPEGQVVANQEDCSTWETFSWH